MTTNRLVRVGLMDLDTGHANPFAKRFNAMAGVTVAAVLDHGDVRKPDEITRFCDRHQCEQVHDVDSLAQKCDVVMSFGIDWSVRLQRTAPLIKRGVAVFLCKPPVGSHEDIRHLIDLQDQTGTPVLAGSGWRWSPDTQALAHKIVLSEITSFEAYAPMPPFYYGIHSWELIAGVFGPGIEWVEPTQRDDAAVAFHCGHTCGIEGMVILGSTRGRSIEWTDRRGRQSFMLTPQMIHEGFCQTAVEMARSGKSPVSLRDQLSSVLAAFAAERSLELGSRVRVDEVPDDYEVDSTAFMSEYSVQPL